MKRYIKHEYKNKSDYGTFFMLEDGSALCRIYGFKDDDSYMVLDSLSVKPNFRNRGIGTRLQEIREEYAKKKNCTHVFLWVEKNSWMIDWYKRRGYIEKGVYDKEDGCVWMRKDFTTE